MLQLRQPDAAIVPVLVCRRRHQRTLRMAVDLGFYAVQYRTQFIRPTPEIRPDHFTQVQFELGYEDMRMTDVPPPSLLAAIRESLVRDAAATCERWARAGPALVANCDRLRRANVTGPARIRALDDLRERAIELGLRSDGW